MLFYSILDSFLMVYHMNIQYRTISIFSSSRKMDLWILNSSNWLTAALQKPSLKTMMINNYLNVYINNAKPIIIHWHKCLDRTWIDAHK